MKCGDPIIVRSADKQQIGAVELASGDRPMAVVFD